MSAADDNGLDAAWLGRTAEPTATAQLAPHTAPTAPLAQSLDGLASMSWGQLRDALIVEHGARQLAELQRNGALSAHKVEAAAHTLTLDALIAKRDECDALRAAVGMAENVIATLRARVETLESLATGPRLVIDEPVVDEPVVDAIDDGLRADDGGAAVGVFDARCDECERWGVIQCRAHGNADAEDSYDAPAGDAT